ncbi:hypothetical protein AB8P62_17345, partial [Yersinia enterocolitica]|uniref:hypothetical protein n=1 Tax=Yersinia enterocolitica TaxID=630 RepID=UPI0037CD2F2F
MQGNSHDFFSVKGVIFVFVSPDGSLSRHRSGPQGRRMRAIYPCGTGCVGKRLAGSRYGNEKHTEGKDMTYIAGRSAPWFAAVKGVWG